jgi:hypothetical protein
MTPTVQSKIIREEILIKWYRGWYSLGWRGWLAKKLLEKELNNF